MPNATEKGIAYAALGVGSIFLYGGFSGKSVLAVIQSLMKGEQPNTTPKDAALVINTSATSADTTAAGYALSAAASASATSATYSISAVANAAIGQTIAATYGWGSGEEWDDLYDLWQRESNWNNTAQNPDSTAYGIAQFLDDTWSTVSCTKTSNPVTQIECGLAYIKQRYGDPIAAWTHEQQFGWY
jgi:soluble lytic murein transglycosylase-like protein